VRSTIQGCKRAIPWCAPVSAALLLLGFNIASSRDSLQTYVTTTQNLPGVVVRVVGGGQVGLTQHFRPTPPKSVGLFSPTALAISPTGTMYIGDTDFGNVPGKATCQLLRVSRSRKLLTTVGPAGLRLPGECESMVYVRGVGLFTIRNGNVFRVSLVDGREVRVRGLRGAVALASSRTGGLFVATGRRIIVIRGTTRRVIAGTTSPGYSGDGGPATSARLTLPTGLAVDPRGNVFVGSDRFGCRIREVHQTTGLITTRIRVPSCPAGGLSPGGIIVNRTGTVYFGAFSGGGWRLFKLDTVGKSAERIAGVGRGSPSVRQVSPVAANRARLSAPMAMQVTRNANLVFCDSVLGLVRELVWTGD